ncbi:MAG: metallophosphoesterase [Candidatus Hodarchaeota archaeon]
MQHILCLADIHGNVKAVKTLVKTLKTTFDLILVAGDLLATTIFPLMLQYISSHFSLSRQEYANWVYKGAGRRAFEMYQLTTGREILNELKSIGKRIIFVPGNVDCQNVLDILQKEYKTSIYILDGDLISFNSFSVSGIGGALPFLSEKGICDGEILERDFKQKRKLLESNKSPTNRFNVLITHEAPAIPALDNVIALSMCGSKELAKLLQKSPYKLVITGHYHERPGFIRIKHTTYLNPGPLARYRFSVVSVHQNQVKVNLFRLQPPISDFTNFIYSLLERNIIK